MIQSEEVVAEAVICGGLHALQIVRVGEPEQETDISEGIYLKLREQCETVHYQGPLTADRVAAFFELFSGAKKV